MLYNFLQTGNPIFPFYNKLFHSVQYPIQNFKDERWGPRALHEIFIYPVVTFLDNSRCNEWSLFSYRLLTGYFVALLTTGCYFIGIKKNKGNVFFKFMMHLSVIALFFDYACIITTGYYRYGIIVEVLYGLIISLWFLYFGKQILSFFLLIIVFLQSYFTFNNICYKQMNLSWHNYMELVQNKVLLKNNAGLLFHDYGQIIDEAKVLPEISGFVNVNPFPQDGLAKMLTGSVPIIDLEPWARAPELMADIEKNVRVRSQKDKLMAVASLEAINAGVFGALNKRGFLISDMYEVYPDFGKYGEPVFLLQIKYLDTARFNISTIEQLLREENPTETKNDFSYNTGHKLRVFLREAPFAYNWDFLQQRYDIFINDKKYGTINRFGKNKILSIEATELRVHKPNEVPYLIIIQDIKEK
jgi:hypothetical protein